MISNVHFLIDYYEIFLIYIRGNESVYLIWISVLTLNLFNRIDKFYSFLNKNF